MRSLKLYEKSVKVDNTDLLDVNDKSEEDLNHPEYPRIDTTD